MKKFCFLFLLGLIFNIYNNAYAFEIVYPKSKEVEINSPATFFIGNENPQKDLFINEEKVPLTTDGAFNYPVKLNAGENIFIIKNNSQHKETYKIINKNNSDKIQKEDVIKQYETPKYAIVDSDNAPLRATPVDSGLNRLQHLEKNIPLKIVGEFNEFYKVQLARDYYAYIKQNQVKISDIDNSPAKIINFTYDENDNYKTYKIKLNKKVPYILYENDGFDLTIFNLIGYPENKYELHINAQNLQGYRSYYKDDNELVIEVKNTQILNKNNPLKNLNITIDPGHGGEEYGAIGCLGDKEKNINLEIATKLQKLLAEKNANVFMTREDDKTISLSDRVEFANKHNSNIFISIHCNATSDNQAFKNKKGVETYYYYPQAKNLATYIQNALVENLSANDGKIHRESFAVVRNSEALAILVEVGYIINPEENSKLIDEDYQNKIAKSIVNGLEKYYNDCK